MSNGQGFYVQVYGMLSRRFHHMEWMKFSRRNIQVSACVQVSAILCIFVQILFVYDQIIQMAFTKLLFKWMQKG